jgi:hypothetical protein
VESGQLTKNSDKDFEKKLAYIKNQFQPDPYFVSQLKEKLVKFPLLEYRQDKTKRLLLFIAIGFGVILTYIAGRNILGASEEK